MEGQLIETPEWTLIKPHFCDMPLSDGEILLIRSVEILSVVTFIAFFVLVIRYFKHKERRALYWAIACFIFTILSAI